MNSEELLGVMRQVLALDAEELGRGDSELAGKCAARVIGEALARAGMQGDVKATALLMELAGADFRSRDSCEKHSIDREKLSLGGRELPRVVIEEARPEME